MKTLKIVVVLVIISIMLTACNFQVLIDGKEVLNGNANKEAIAEAVCFECLTTETAVEVVTTETPAEVVTTETPAEVVTTETPVEVVTTETPAAEATVCAFAPGYDSNGKVVPSGTKVKGPAVVKDNRNLSHAIIIPVGTEYLTIASDEVVWSLIGDDACALAQAKFFQSYDVLQ